MLMHGVQQQTVKYGINNESKESLDKRWLEL
jgi:hypothetical protein